MISKQSCAANLYDEEAAALLACFESKDSLEILKFVDDRDSISVPSVNPVHKVSKLHPMMHEIIIKSNTNNNLPCNLLIFLLCYQIN